LSFTADLTAAFVGDAGVTALVGRRIQWLTRPQAAALPAIVLQTVSAPRDYTLTSRVGLVGYLVQVSCWAATHLEAKAIAAAVIALADSLHASPFQGAFVENEREGFETVPAPQAGAAPATGLYRTDLDLRIQHLNLA
jgi:hypothetical protein